MFKVLGALSYPSNEEPRRSIHWQESWLAFGGRCAKCQRRIWRRGLIGMQFWVYDIERFKCHIECRALDILGGNDA